MHWIEIYPSFEQMDLVFRSVIVGFGLFLWDYEKELETDHLKISRQGSLNVSFACVSKWSRVFCEIYIIPWAFGGGN